MEITRLLSNTKTFEENLKRLNCNNCSTFVFFYQETLQYTSICEI